MRKITCISMLVLAAMPALAQGGPQGARPLLLPSATASDIITNTPAGTLHSGLYRQSVGFFYGTKRNADGMSGAYVVAPDKKTYYIQDIFSQYRPGTWVRGELRGDTIYVPTPQHIDSYQSSDGGIEIYLRNLKYDNNQQTYVVDTDNTEAKFVMSGDTLKQVSPQLLGMTYDDGTYMLYGDYNLVMFPNKDVVTTPPADLKTERYALSYKDEYGDAQSKLVKLSIGSSDAWLGEFSSEYPNAWIKGTVKNNRITFNSKQYLGYTNSHHYYFVAGVTVPIADPETGETGETYEMSRNIRLDYDGDTYKSDNVMFTNWGKLDVNFRECFSEPRLSKFVETEQTPSNPTIQAFKAYDSSYKYGSLSFTIPTVSTTGVALNPDSLFYNVYTDERLLTFRATKYGLAKDMTDIPYNFTDGKTFVTSTSDPNTRIIYYLERVGTYYKRIGVQAIYRTAGKEHKSSIIYSDGTEVPVTPATGISSTGALKGEPVTTYYDLSGRKVTKPSSGVYVKSERFADGTTKQSKVIMK